MSKIKVCQGHIKNVTSGNHSPLSQIDGMLFTPSFRMKIRFLENRQTTHIEIQKFQDKLGGIY